jgi:hypothetical protein
MLNWKTYKKLSNKQKEEYNFRFKDEIEPPLQFAFLLVLLMVGMVTTKIFLMYLVITEPALSSYQYLTREVFITSSRLVLVVSWMLIGLMGQYVIRVLIRYQQFNKWVKTNNIKIIRWWNEVKQK